jgi:hypothetical protein
MHVGHDQRRPGVAGERRPPGQQLEQQDAEGVDVGRRGGVVAEHPLWRQVRGRSEQVATGQGRLVDRAGDAEVEQLHVAAAGHEDVARLDVAVHDPGPVGDLERVGGRGHDPDRLRRRQRAGARQPGGQALPAQQLHDEVGAAGVLAEIQDAGDPGVRQPARRPCLPP